MKILYGIQGTGNGHIARARIMAQAFQQRPDVEVDYFFTGRDTTGYFDMDVFGEYQTRHGLTFITENGALNRFKTLKKAKVIQFLKDVHSLDLSTYDLVLNDFEPVSAWAAKLQNVPSLSISHQAAFNCEVPREQEDIIDKLVTKHFAPTQYALGVHWYHFNQNIIPPFVPRDIVENSKQNTMIYSAKRSEFVLVYLPFESITSIEQTLLPLSEYRFHCYHPEIMKNRSEGNIDWFAPSKEQFHNDLVACNKVIANGGFELATECLSLGKALMMKPLTGQFEQFSNAFTLRTLDIATTLYHLDSEAIEEWLDSETATQIGYPNNTDTFINWILAGKWDDTQSICQQLWQQVEFPQNVSQKLAQINLS